MNRPELYKKTVDILYEAYFNDTLRHGVPCGCAVGNIILANCGNVSDNWFFFLRPENKWEYEVVNNAVALKELISTGYSIKEIDQIEHAFEKCECPLNEDGSSDEEAYMFNGLVAVLEVLKQIHEVKDNEPEVTRFRNHYTSLVK